MSLFEQFTVLENSLNKFEEKSDFIYNYIYDNIVNYCVEQIEHGNYSEAYNRYKNSVLALEEQFVGYKLKSESVKTLKLV